MRTTITFDADVARAVQRVRRERRQGLNQAVNDLIRAGLQSKTPRAKFRQRAHDMGSTIDLRNIAEALDLLEGPGRR